jgi:hypothetical protein
LTIPPLHPPGRSGFSLRLQRQLYKLRINPGVSLWFAAWEALTLSPNQIAYADCVARVTLIAARLKQQFDLAD